MSDMALCLQAWLVTLLNCCNFLPLDWPAVAQPSTFHLATVLRSERQSKLYPYNLGKNGKCCLQKVFNFFTYFFRRSVIICSVVLPSKCVTVTHTETKINGSKIRTSCQTVFNSLTYKCLSSTAFIQSLHTVYALLCSYVLCGASHRKA